MNAVEIAIKMETDAIKFYKEAAARTNHPVGKKMFESITEDEKQHHPGSSQSAREARNHKEIECQQHQNPLTAAALPREPNNSASLFRVLFPRYNLKSK